MLQQCTLNLILRTLLSSLLRYYSVLSEARFTLSMSPSRVEAITALPTWVTSNEDGNDDDEDDDFDQSGDAAAPEDGAVCSTCFAGTRYLTDQEVIRNTFLDVGEQNSLMQGACRFVSAGSYRVHTNTVCRLNYSALTTESNSIVLLGLFFF